MSSPKTNCKNCGTEILQITADLNEGRCMPCKNADMRKDVLIPERIERVPILDHHTTDVEVLVSIFFHPGFDPDLTSWIFQITRDGVMRQSVWWWKPVEDSSEEELEPVRLDEATMMRLRALVDEAESLRLSDIKHLSYIDDAAMVSIRIPRSGEHADVPMFQLQYEIRKKRQTLTEVEKPRFAVVEAIWMLADKYARHSAYKKRR